MSNHPEGEPTSVREAVGGCMQEVGCIAVLFVGTLAAGAFWFFQEPGASKDVAAAVGVGLALLYSVSVLYKSKHSRG